MIKIMKPIVNRIFHNEKHLDEEVFPIKESRKIIIISYSFQNTKLIESIHVNIYYLCSNSVIPVLLEVVVDSDPLLARPASKYDCSLAGVVAIIEAADSTSILLLLISNDLKDE